MKYRVKLSYPTIIETEGNTYMLFPEHEIELPESSEIIKTYEGLGYIEKVEIVTNKKKKEVTDAS